MIENALTPNLLLPPKKVSTSREKNTGNKPEMHPLAIRLLDAICDAISGSDESGLLLTGCKQDMSFFSFFPK